MSDGKRAYRINLCYDALYSKKIEITADTLLEACLLAMKHADEDG